MGLLTGVLATAGGVAKDQAEADEDMSLKQRAMLAAGSAMGGASEMVDNEVLAAVLEVGGQCVRNIEQFLFCEKYKAWYVARANTSIPCLFFFKILCV